MGFWRNRAAAALTAGIVLLGIAGSAASQPWRYSDDEVALGFNATVFGAEHGTSRFAFMVKKFEGPVRLRIVDSASQKRSKAIAVFVKNLRRTVRGLDIRLAGPGEAANFTLHVVDGAAYQETVRREVFGTRSGRAPGRCLVKLDVGDGGIRHSTAVIVSDQGEHLFRRCMVEEILQGLGPMNDDSRLIWSVFNDRSEHSGFTVYDQAILNVLYDPRVRHGMSERQVRKLLPDVIATVRNRME